MFNFIMRYQKINFYSENVLQHTYMLRNIPEFFFKKWTLFLHVFFTEIVKAFSKALIKHLKGYLKGKMYLLLTISKTYI